jgi:hypothetical protein
VKTQAELMRRAARAVASTIVVMLLAPTPDYVEAARLGSPAVISELMRRACASVEGRSAGGLRRAAIVASPSCVAPLGTVRRDRNRFRPAVLQAMPDGALLGRQRIAANDSIALDVIAYASTGLSIGGLLCYPNDGSRHSTVIHVPGGAGGAFTGVAGDMVQTCIDWAALHGRTAFIPSLRGNDGGDGAPELCLGEGDDVVAAAAMLRGLEVTGNAPLGLVGGSIGGCVALRAAPFIPSLAAVVAFVPPTSWKQLITYHRTSWTARTELDCNGLPVTWNLGGPAFADALESIICGHEACSDADFDARSPLPFLVAQNAPTLIVSAEFDNIVPLDQQLLWSILRQSIGNPVSVFAVDPCDPPGTPPLVTDGHIFSRRSFHLLPSGPVSSGLLFLMAHLDAVAADGVQ